MRTKNNLASFFLIFILPLICVFLFLGIKSFFSGWDEIEKENAFEKIYNCENPYEFWQGVDGRTCDEARKTYNDFTEEEWREEKKKLIDFGRITEQDYLYDELKLELMREEKIRVNN